MRISVAAERRLRTEVALLTGIGDAGWYVYEGGSSGRRYPGGEIQVASGGVALVEAPDEDTAPEDPQTQFAGALEAAIAAGLISDEGAAWLRELTRRCGLPPVPMAATGERVAAIERLVEELLRQAAAESTGIADMRFRLALDTAAGLGILDENSRRRHEERLEQLYRDQAKASEPARHDGSGSEPLTGFKGVAPGPGERNGQRLIAVECFERGLVIRWETKYELPAKLRGRPTGEVYDRFRPPDDSFDLALSDDAGTEYEPGGGGGSAHVTGDHWVSTWTCRVEPGVPQDARVLTVALNGEPFQVDVAGFAERPGT
jgi:hypothetical protein